MQIKRKQLKRTNHANTFTVNKAPSNSVIQKVSSSLYTFEALEGIAMSQKCTSISKMALNS